MTAETIGLGFKVVESMMFRKPGEFDPTSRGVYSRASSFSLPTPSTIAGSIATLILSQNPSISPSGGTWEDEYKSVLGNAELRGPFLFKSGDILVAYGEKGVKLTDLPGLVRAYWNVVQMKVETYGDVVKWMQEFEKLSKQLKDWSRPLGRYQERIGVGLEKRATGIKVVDERRGLLYSSTYIDYVTSKEDVGAVEICVDARDLQLELNKPKAVKLGGESRISILLRREKSVFDLIKDRIWNQKDSVQGPMALYIASPALFNCKLSKEKLIEAVKNKLKYFEAGSVRLVGSVSILGAGFSLSRGRRKPIYSALEPGSMIFADFPKQYRLEEIYWHSLSEVGGQVGYGTVIPVPLT